MITLWHFLGKLLFLIGYPILWFAARYFSGDRVRVLVVDRDGRVLLVKTWLGNQKWSLPGGGINQSEHPKEAAARELYEEAGIAISPEQLQNVGTFAGKESLKFQLLVYKVTIDEAVMPKLSLLRRLEIIDRVWCEPDQLPSSLSPVVSWALKRDR